MKEQNFEIIVTPLPEEEGGGFVAVVPDLQGCMSDGETPEAALTEVLDAITVWAEAQRAKGHDMPEPGWRYREAAERHEELLQLLEEQKARIDALLAETGRLKSASPARASYGAGRYVFRTDVVSGRVWTDQPAKESDALEFPGKL